MKIADINRMIVTGKTHNGNKDEFHRLAKRYLKDIAIGMGLNPDQYDIRSNKGGPAVLGEVILHTDNLYVCLGGSVPWGTFYYRTCKGRKDHTGGINVMPKYDILANQEEMIRLFKNHSDFRAIHKNS